MISKKKEGQKTDTSAQNTKPAASTNAVTFIGSGGTYTDNHRDTYDGYDYELWMDYDAIGSMTVGKKGTFACSWESITEGRGNFLARSGKKFDSLKKLHSDIGEISVKYNAAKYSPIGNGVSYLCIYGWTRPGNGAPLVEYYIVDNWGLFNRPVPDWEKTKQKKGEFTIDGDVYEIFVTTKTGAPSIVGNTDFLQYWSSRKNRRTSGTISVSEHFKKWEELGMKLGNLYEVSLCLEGYNLDGSTEIIENIISINGVPIQ